MSETRNHKPPKWADRFLEWYCAPDQLDDVQGALYEYFSERVDQGRITRARRMFILDVLSHFRPHIIKRNKTHYSKNNIGMYKNFIKVSFRNIRKHKLTTSLNLIGLSVGITSFLLIMMWVNQEKTFDAFHENADNLYRISNTFKSESEQFSQAPSGPALGAQLHKLYPQIVNAARYGNNSAMIKVGDQSFFENNMSLVDANFFEMFTWEVVQGDQQKFFENPNSIVLTESLAKKYFGDAPAMGKMLTMDDNLPITVTGILKDPPSNSQMQFDSFISLDLAKIMWENTTMDDNWGGGWFHTYVQLETGTDVDALMAEVNQFIATKLTWFSERNMSYEYFLQPIKSIHLQSDLRYDFGNNGSARNVSIFSTVALIILILACINYINLTTATAIKRAKEVGIKKVIGALRGQLVVQYLIESVLVSLIAAIFAVGLVYLLLPGFESFVGYKMTVPEYPSVLTLLFSGAVLLGLIAGLFPALAISSFNPLSVLKGQLNSGRRGTTIRKLLVVGQFTATIALIIAIITVNGQMRHLQNQELGMNTDEVISIDFRGLESVINNKEALTNRLLENPNFKAVSFNRNAYPVDGLSNGMVMVETSTGDKVSSSLYHMWVDTEYATAFDMTMAAGRFFSKEIESDISNAIVVNESAVASFGWGSPEAGIGKKMGNAPNERTVIGVVKDFNFEGLHKRVEPLRIVPITNPTSYSAITLKANLSQPFEAIGFLQKIWQELNPEVPLDYTIMNDDIRNQYNSELQFRSLFLIFSVLSVVIAGLGLFGLATASTNQRIKEIGIRKTLGASTFGLIQLISRDFVILILVSLVLAIPLAWYGMEQWLSGFAYRINVSWVFFVTAGLLAIGVSLLTISYQALKAAYRNPTKSLRYE